MALVTQVGLWLCAASAFFWLSWLLMPGVGMTDPRPFRAVNQHRCRSVDHAGRNQGPSRRQGRDPVEHVL
jgi:hypothetical protein